MKVYFEGTKYKHSLIDERLKLYFNEINDKDETTTEYVGYYAHIDSVPIVILPKIFTKLVKDNKDIIEKLSVGGFKSNKTSYEGVPASFVSKIVYLFYLSLIKFLKRNPKSELSKKGCIYDVKLTKSSMDTTELETVIALEAFYIQHKDLLSFKHSESNSKNFANVDWKQTIRSTTPTNIGRSVLYSCPITTEEDADFSDELLTVYFSLLNYFTKLYGKNFSIDSRYTLISHRNFSSFVNKSRKILRRINGQHFDDRYIRLSKLLKSYFEIQPLKNKNVFKEDKLLIKGYNIVFEDMIDLLLSDKKVLNELKNQRDGKVVDHIYQYNGLFGGDDIYYIGDSKYYKDTTAFSNNSKYKQFTYAKNVIQFNVDPFAEHEKLTYRDEITEGYNLSPSFFINGYLFDTNLSNPTHGFKVDESSKTMFLCQFENRVFDRDSLYLCYFKLNFLFILQSYIIENKVTISNFRNISYELIRNHYLKLYNDNYQFYKLKPNIPLEDFVNKFFRVIHGKIYRGNSDIKNNTITLALNRSETYEKSNNELIQELINFSSCDKFELC